MKYNDLLNELMDLLDENPDIKKMKRLKNDLINDTTFQSLIQKYKIEKTVSNKVKLYENSKYLEYLKCENNINLLIQDIKRKFNVFNNRKCYHESH